MAQIALHDVQQALGKLEQAFPDDAAERYVLLLRELERWNQRINLTAIRDPSAMLTAHLLDSLAVRPLIEGERVLDVGTGAGFPGLPLAVAEPKRCFALLDSHRRKLAFVQHAAGLIRCNNVQVIAARAEDYAPEVGFDTVIARAVADLASLVAMAGHLLGEDGVFIALKGRYPADELQQISKSWKVQVVALSVPGLDAGTRHAVMLRRA